MFLTGKIYFLLTVIPQIRDPTHDVKVEGVLISLGHYLCLPKLCRKW